MNIHHEQNFFFIFTKQSTQLSLNKELEGEGLEPESEGEDLSLKVGNLRLISTPDFRHGSHCV